MRYFILIVALLLDPAAVLLRPRNSVSEIPTRFVISVIE
jgi:hypothetical protein